MYVKKRMSLLLFAALAMVLFTACGRWDFSREAAKAANEAQNAVVFEASATLAQSLKDALEDNVRTADVKAAMKADERLDDLLGRLDVYAVESDDAEAAAQTIADGYIKHISGRKSDGHIAMVSSGSVPRNRWSRTMRRSSRASVVRMRLWSSRLSMVSALM